MSGLAIAVQAALAESAITALVGQRIYPIYAPQNAGLPYIVVHKIAEEEEKLLDGASNWPVSRVSFECVSEGDAAVADRIGQVLNDQLKIIHRATYAGFEATFTKEGTDETDSGNETLPSGFSIGARRIIDFYIRWRTAP